MNKTEKMLQFFQSHSLKNIGWLFFDRAFKLLIGLIVGLWFARYLGKELFGVWNYALAFVSIFGVVAFFGTDSIVARDLVRSPKNIYKILGTAITLRIVISVAMVLVTTLSINLLNADEQQLKPIVYILSLSFIFQSFDVFDYYFNSQVKSKYSVLAKSVALIVASVLRIVLILIESDLLFFALVFNLELLISGLFTLLLFQLKEGSIFNITFDTVYFKNMITDGLPLLFATVMLTIYMKVDQIMLGEMVNNAEVGIYSAAVKISELWYFIPMAIAITISPKLINSRKVGLDNYYNNLTNLYSIMIWLSIFVGVFFSLTSDFIVNLAYGAEYKEAADILKIHIWAGLAVSVGIATSQFLLIENINWISFYRTAIGMIINVLLNFLLIPDMGGIGAAWATFISYTFATISIVFFPHSRNQIKLIFIAINPKILIKHLKK